MFLFSFTLGNINRSFPVASNLLQEWKHLFILSNSVVLLHHALPVGVTVEQFFLFQFEASGSVTPTSF